MDMLVANGYMANGQRAPCRTGNSKQITSMNTIQWHHHLDNPATVVSFPVHLNFT
jgi:hypothetical protein